MSCSKKDYDCPAQAVIMPAFVLKEGDVLLNKSTFFRDFFC